MADKVCALLGSGQGPWVYTGNMKIPVVCASGVFSGIIEVESSDKPMDLAPQISFCEIEATSKNAPIKQAQYTRVKYGGPESKIIVHILAR